MASVAQSHRGEGLKGSTLDFPCLGPGNPERKGDILVNTSILKEFKILENDSQLASQERNLIPADGIRTEGIYPDEPPGWKVVHIDKTKNRAFPHTTGTGQEDKFPPFNTEGDVLDNVPLIVFLVKEVLFQRVLYQVQGYHTQIQIKK